MAVPRRFRKPIARHARLVRKEAKRLGVSPEALLAKVGKGESGFSEKSVSSAGARKAYQFIRSTRNAYKQKYGIDAWGSPDEQVHAAALHIRNTGLAGYNPGMSTYSNYILGQKVGNVRKQIGKGGGSSGGKTTTKTIPGTDLSDERRDVVKQYFAERNRSDALLNLARGLKETKSTPDRTVTTKVKGKDKTAKGGGKAGTVTMDGYPVNASIAADLKWAKKHGWGGEVISGWRDPKRVITGAGPVAPQGQSQHRFKRPGRGAVDVTDPEGLKRVLRKRRTKLRHAGSADPPHFSQGAPAGSY